MKRTNKAIILALVVVSSIAVQTVNASLFNFGGSDNRGGLVNIGGEDNEGGILNIGSHNRGGLVNLGGEEGVVNVGGEEGVVSVGSGRPSRAYYHGRADMREEMIENEDQYAPTHSRWKSTNDLEAHGPMYGNPNVR